jgi:serralysin
MKRLLTTTVLAASVLAASAAPAQANHREPAPTSTIAGLVAASGGAFDDDRYDYDILLTAVSAAGLVGALDDPTAQLTVFAPTDRAFTRLARDLGYDEYDEQGAWEYLVAQLTALGGGDPIPTLTNVLLYHVSPGADSLRTIRRTKTIDTLFGATFTVKGNRLVDVDPDITNPRFNDPTDLRATNGIVHTISRVLIPVDLP